MLCKFLLAAIEINVVSLVCMSPVLTGALSAVEKVGIIHQRWSTVRGGIATTHKRRCHLCDRNNTSLVITFIEQYRPSGALERIMQEDSGTVRSLGRVSRKRRQVADGN